MDDQGKLELGKLPNNRWFRLPVDIVTETIAILGRRGSGKTNTGTVIVEGLLEAGQQAVILDPLDVWWGLKSQAEGDKAAYPVLVIGDTRKPHTDLPLEEHDAKTIADFVTEQRVPVVLSMRHLSKSARRRFAAAFLEEFYHRKGDPERATPCCLVIDEASTFVPQSMKEADQARLVGAVESCVRQGRSSGIGVVLIDQRPASVNKDVLTQVEMLIVHQLTGPHDQKAVRDWVTANDADGHEKEFMGSLASLETGEAWVWSPGWLKCFERLQIAMRRTFDSSRTPRAGETAITPTELAEVDLDAMREKLSTTIERARADDPKVLKGRIAELERELAKPQINQDSIDAAVVSAVSENNRWWTLRVDGEVSNVLQAIGGLKDLSGDAHEMLSADPDPGPNVEPPAVAPAVAVGSSAAVGEAAASSRSTGKRTPVERVIDAYATWHSLGHQTVDRTLAAVVAGYKNPRSEGFLKPRRDAISQGLLNGDELTTRGKRAARVTEVTTLNEHHRRLAGVLSGPAARLMNIVISVGPNSGIAREELAEHSGYSNQRSEGFLKPLRDLKQAGLVDVPHGGGMIKGTALLFPHGLPS